jgi:hypothetical protein
MTRSNAHLAPCDGCRWYGGQPDLFTRAVRHLCHAPQAEVVVEVERPGLRGDHAFLRGVPTTATARRKGGACGPDATLYASKVPAHAGK